MTQVVAALELRYTLQPRGRPRKVAGFETLPREPAVIETFKLITSAKPLPAR